MIHINIEKRRQSSRGGILGEYDFCCSSSSGFKAEAKPAPCWKSFARKIILINPLYGRWLLQCWDFPSTALAVPWAKSPLSAASVVCWFNGLYGGSRSSRCAIENNTRCAEVVRHQQNFPAEIWPYTWKVRRFPKPPLLEWMPAPPPPPRNWSTELELAKPRGPGDAQMRRVGWPPPLSFASLCLQSRCDCSEVDLTFSG